MIYIIESDGRKREGVKVRCLQCNKEYIARKSFYDKGKCVCCSRACSSLLQRKRIIKKCDFCGKEFERIAASIKNSRTGLLFCSRKCKDLALRLNSGEKFQKMRPDHYGTANGKNHYRDKAFEYYLHECANPKCGYNEDDRLLEVHHRDFDKNNNEIENLVILCCMCHKRVTLNYYKLNENNELIEVNNGGHWVSKNI